ncbi:hypothetical protein NITHO_310005 [Nitrolancea hollandica Lb]|uniref:Uncharacterized protein n=1 Tax=Nitrolancea hollandica Lb TaxID=1129897 RepID=I4EHF0_9BACT|nr:hypothetical protein NITHO_310005 [Nitrolancea hollandica Lb]
MGLERLGMERLGRRLRLGLGRLRLVKPTPTARDPAPRHPLGFSSGCRALVRPRQMPETRLDEPIAGTNPTNVTDGFIDQAPGDGRSRPSGHIRSAFLERLKKVAKSSSIRTRVRTG